MLCAKKLKIFAVPELCVRDVVSCFKLYLSLVQLDGPFFTKQIVGKNKLQVMTKNMCKSWTRRILASHRGKMTCVTELSIN